MNRGNNTQKDLKNGFEIQNIQQRIKSKSRNPVQPKGPVKASYEIPQENWEVKYQYRSPKTVQGIKNKKKQNTQEESSDYGTMSRVDKTEQMLVDAIPLLNLNDTHGGNGIFNDVSIDERKERVASILDEILSIPRLVEANITQRNLKSGAAMSKFLATDSVRQPPSYAGSRASGMSSMQGTSRTRQSEKNSSRSKPVEQFSSRPRQFEPKLRRSISTPKLENISERKAIPKAKTATKKSAALQRQSEVPNLNLDLNNSSQSSLPDIAKVRNSRTEDDISAEFLPTKNHAMKNFVPNLGDDTQNELAFCAPTMGDDTINLNEDDTFDMNDKTNESINFVKANMNLDIHKKDPATGRSSSASTLAPKHKTGSVPKYLKARQAQWAEEAKQLKASIPDPDCPAGHVRLGEDERIEKLSSMTTKHAELLHDLNRLPVSSDTRRVVLKRREIEGLLVWVEEEIRKFSRPKVFVPENEQSNNL